MKIYEVGGSVRDALLGRVQQDRDYVVVGASPEAMLEQGFIPVGQDFPVFLHPKTRAEYALARTERKSGRGYKGFSVYAAPNVTLEEDLARRDLTINAMARDEVGNLIDPYGGQADLAARILRHVSPAFSEDPVRILRLARFSARFPDFQVAPETLVLMREMVASGEVDFLVPERVWQEVSRALMEVAPANFFKVLRACGALARLMPALDRLFGVPQPPQYHPEVDTGIHTLLALAVAVEEGASLPVRWAVLMHDLGKGVTDPAWWPHHYGHEGAGVPLVQALCAQLKVPVDCRDLAVMTAREHTHVHGAMAMRADTLIKFLVRCDALRRSERFFEMVQACRCDARGRTGLEQVPYAPQAYLQAVLRAISQVNVGQIARQWEGNSEKIADQIFRARVDAVKAHIADIAAMKGPAS